jgi:predicted nucleic acid-binding protein
MKLFLDANVVLDLILKRQPFFVPIAEIVTIAESKNFTLCLSSVTFVNVNYIACKFTDKKNVSESLKKLRILFDVLTISETEIDKALYSNFNDFEDAVLKIQLRLYHYKRFKRLQKFRNSSINTHRIFSCNKILK